MMPFNQVVPLRNKPTKSNVDKENSQSPLFIHCYFCDCLRIVKQNKKKKVVRLTFITSICNGSSEPFPR